MFRRWVSRVCPLLALAFLTAAGEALPGHACPHHDALPAAPADASHAGHGPAHHGPSQDGGADHGAAACTCVGACQAGADATFTADRIAHSGPDAPAFAAVALPAGSDPPAPRPLPYRLHQPNAPPARV